MSLHISPMTLPEAKEVSDWRYPPPYDLYDMESDDEGLTAWISDAGDEGRYSVYSDGTLIGFLSFGPDTLVPGGDYPTGSLDVGFGMKPEFTGRGLGLAFVGAAIEYAERNFQNDTLRLTVAEFNERAIKVYERAGFSKIAEFVSSKGRPFVQMERDPRRT